MSSRPSHSDSAGGKKVIKKTGSERSKTSTSKTPPKKSTKSQLLKKQPKPDPFLNKDYYECFGIDRNATDEDIIKAYKRLALQYHPDRCGGDKFAAKQFAKISKMHQTLIDSRKRKFYDQHGEASDMSDGFLNAYDLWKETFPAVTVDDTEAFKVKYEDTEEEYTDVVNAFNTTKGDLFKMMKDHLFFSKPETAQRDQNMVEMLIKRGDIKNIDYINNFNKNKHTAVVKLKKVLEEEEKQYQLMEQIAHERALKKSKTQQVCEIAKMSELKTLLMQANRSTEGADTLENIALALGLVGGADNETKSKGSNKSSSSKDVSGTKMVKLSNQEPPQKGGRMASKQQPAPIAKISGKDLGSDFEDLSDEDGDDEDDYDEDGDDEDGDDEDNYDEDDEARPLPTKRTLAEDVD
jgi:curved DNA-binding protein CbpA